MMTPLRCFFLLVILSLAACSRKEARPEAREGPEAAARRPYQTLAAVPEELQRNAQAFAKELEQNIRSRSMPALRAAFDRVAMVEGICLGVAGNSERLNNFRSGLQQGIQTGIQQIATAWSQEDAKFKRLVIYKGDLAARFRFVSEGTVISITDLVVRTNLHGGLGIANLCNHAIGYDMLEESRRAATPILGDIDKTFLERVLDKPGLSPGDVLRFGQLAQKVRARDPAGAIELYKSLPDPLRETTDATGLYIAALHQSGDLQAHKKALEEAAARFKSPHFQFMLVEVYARDREFDKAVGCVESFMGAVEKDAALLALKAVMLNAKGDVSAARALLREAFELEPDCVYAHAKGIDVLLAAKDFPAVRESMIFLEKNAQYNFKGKMTGNVWDDFKKAPESAPWR